MNYYIVPKYISEGVFNSQMLERAVAIKKLYQVDYSFLSRSKQIQSFKININRIESLKAFIRGTTNKDQIYTRSFSDYLYLLPLQLLGRKLIYDFRGFASYESYYRNNSLIKFLIIFFIEFICYISASYVFTVSNKFRDVLKKKFFFKRNIHVVPCLISQDNISIKEVSDSNSKFVFIGSLNHWQKIDTIINIFNNINFNGKYTLSIITNDLELAGKHIGSEYQHISCFKLDKIAIKDILKNYDYGFLIRDNILLNNVSSPIKFLEYCASGVIPILSDNIGDYSKIVEDNNIGIVLKDSDNLEDMLKNIESIRDIKIKCKKFSLDYTWEKYLQNNLNNSPRI